MPLGDVGGWFRTPEQNTETIEPTPDTTSGHNFPYRGGEQHGVAPTGQEYNPAEEWMQGQAPSYQDVAEEETVRPVPVRIVQETAREFAGWATSSAVVDGTVRQVAGRHLRRSRLTIKNLSATITVYIGTSMSTNYISGFPIDPAEDITLSTEDEVYAISATGAAVNLSILSEFSVAM